MTILEFIFRVYRSATTQCRTQEIYQTHGQQPAVPTTCGRLLRADRHRRQVRAIFLAEVIICSRHDERHLRPEEIMMMLQTLLLTFCGTAYFSTAASTLVGARLLLGKKKTVTLDHGRRCLCRAVADVRHAGVVWDKSSLRYIFDT